MDNQKASGLSLSGVSWAHSAQGDLPPDGIALGAAFSVCESGEQVPTRTEVVADGAERSQETLSVLGGFEALEYPLAFPCGQVRNLRPIVQTLVSPMLSVRQHPPNRWPVACQLMGDHHARFITGAVNNLTQEALGCLLIAPRLDEDVQHYAILIDGSAQPVAFAADLQQDLIEMSLVARSCSSPT